MSAPAEIADAAATEQLLRCWVRETGLPVPPHGDLRLQLAATGTCLTVPVLHRSPTGWHRFGLPRLSTGAVADAATVGALVVREVITRTGAPAHAGAAALARLLDSAARVATHVAQRQAAPADPPGTSPFLAAEQALLLGHPFHPTPKSRGGVTEREAADLSPELRGSFPLHWFAAHPSVVADAAAGDRDVPAMTRALAGDGLRLPPDAIAVPAHPWQARDLVRRPDVQKLLDAGLLHDLGPAGPRWYPTSSIRTVYRPDASVMLKLSLGLRITNSRRNNLRGELVLGVRAAQLLRAGLAAQLRRAHPAFEIVRDPAWISVDLPGPVESGFETVIRDNPFGPHDRVACVAGLVAERAGQLAADPRSQLAGIVVAIAARTGAAVPEVTATWFARYLEVVAAPLLWLYAEHGLALEAHHQNTLVLLDDAGWPIGGRYRDSQGYYVAAGKADRLTPLLAGFGDGLPVVFDDELVNERFGYYLGVNNLLGLIGAAGAQGLADERALLRVLRRRLQRFGCDHGQDTPDVVRSLLDAPTLRCKANLLTCVDGRDELAATVASQALYVDIPNPIAAVRS
jgi:siderophore synthetase component